MQAMYDQVEDLVSDEGFLAWYMGTDLTKKAEWDRRLSGDPALKKLADEAMVLLQDLRVREKEADATALAMAEKKLQARLDVLTPEGESPAIPIRRRNRWWAAAAAILVLASGFVIWQLAKGNSEPLYETRFGEVRNETLPDGSVVMLNANTQLRFTKAWHTGADREVWLTGEAFFQVTTTPQRDKFVVHTDNFDVIVTGTQFNVLNRDNKNNIFLKSGRVTIRSKTGAEIHMKPGEFVEYAASGIRQKIVSESPVTAWKERKFIFEKTPMKDVAQSVTEAYGIRVTLSDDSVGLIPVSGIFPNDNLDIFLKSLEASQDFEIRKTGNSIQIGKK